MKSWLNYISFIGVGFGATVLVCAASILIGLGVAFAVGTVRFMRLPILHQITTVYVEIFRGTSLLIQLFWIYFSLPTFGLSLSPWTAALVGLSLNNGAYGSEVVRGALASVSLQQFEAATALNFSPAHTLRRITLPQAIPEMIPPLGNLAILLLKDTALISMISIQDVTFRAQQLRIVTHDSAGVYTIALMIYFIIALAILSFIKLAEFYANPQRRMSKAAPPTL